MVSSNSIDSCDRSDSNQKIGPFTFSWFILSRKCCGRGGLNNTYITNIYIYFFYYLLVPIIGIPDTCSSSKLQEVSLSPAICDLIIYV